MSPSSREKAYARRRYEAYQQKIAAKESARRLRRRNLLAAVGAFAAVGLVVGAVVFLAGGDDDVTTDAAASPSVSASASASPSGVADPDNPCDPAVEPPATPQQFDTAPDPATAQGKTFEVSVETTCGPMTLTLDGAKAPKAVASFVSLAEQGYFDDTPCHRLTTAGIFVLQCGDPTGTGTGGPGYEFGPVENAPGDDLYPAGTVAMARQGGNGNSMGSQFFLVYADSTIPSDAAGGYTVMGEVSGGLDTVQQVADGGVTGGGTDGAPSRAVSILSTGVQGSG